MKPHRSRPLAVYLPPDVSEFPYPVYEEVNLIRRTNDECYGFVQLTNNCACPSRDGMAVREHVFMCRNDASYVGHTAFRLPSYDRNSVEFRSALTWLLCMHFKFDTYHVFISEDKRFCRTIVPAIDKLFKQNCINACGCKEYILRDVEILHFLFNFVVSSDKKGPTFESVLLKK